VRKVDDSISGSSVTVDEYCAGNRIVTVRGMFVSIVDYDKQELTEIDHTNGTYAVTRFDEIAKARSHSGSPAAAAALKKNDQPSEPKWKSTPLGAKASTAGRSVESVEIVRDHPKEKIDVGIDRQIALSKEAIEVLIGASYPNSHSEELDLILGAAAPAHSGRANVASVEGESYGLPAEQTITIESDNAVITLHSAILAVNNDSVPPQLLMIDAHAKRVESRITRTTKELEQLDQLPSASKP